MKKIKVAILGLGTVGGGTYDILKNNKEIISKRAEKEIQVTKILDRRKKPSIEECFFVDEIGEILEDPSIDIVVETLGGIEPATSFMIEAMKKGKHVVTANKAAVATNYLQLKETAKKHHVEFLFEASVGGGIPILTSIENPLQGNHFTQVMGILNGTTNYILSKMERDGCSYEEGLQDAQARGFAEADPTADVEGIDVANKLSILITLLFDQYISPMDIPREGITKITVKDITRAKEERQKIKLIGKAALEGEEVRCSVKPEFIPDFHPLASVNDEFNAVYITGDMVDQVMFYGKGAGALPTGSAIVGDIISIAKKL